MDEKEQADRLAAAEALYMISTRVDKSGAIQKSPRMRRKKKSSDHVDDKLGKQKAVDGDCVSAGRRSGSSSGDGRRGRSGGGISRRGAIESRGGGGSRGRGGRGGGSSPRGKSGRGGSSMRNQRQSGDAVINHETLKQHSGRNNKHGTIVGSHELSQHHSDELKHTPKARILKVRHHKLKPNSTSKDTVGDLQRVEVEAKAHPRHAIGFTGAMISISESPKPGSYDTSQTLQSHGLVSGLKQVTLTSNTLSSTMSVLSLPSMNLASFTPDVNLPSIPLEIGSLQLSSQPTPNLSSLGDLAEGALEDGFTIANRKKSEKFLPLKKRKLHNPSEPEVRAATPTVEASSLSDCEERSNPPQSPPPPVVEPFRASFTVQAPPIITMQTLMEIKTALTADDDGDLPLHIAVVHENMRMVMKLITLMRIAGKGVDKFNKQQQTPLHLAVKLNFLGAVDILLKSSANVNAVDCTGSSSIHMAVQGRSTECLTMLLERCPHADLNARNFEGLTPLHIAVDNGDLILVETLLKYNADIDVTDGKSGRTALFWAAESNQKTMVELLLNKGANADVPNYAGVTTAMAAQGRNLHGVLKLLGSVATDKFTEFDVKPSELALEPKPSPVFHDQLSSDNLAFSQHNVARSMSLPKHYNSEVACLEGPKMNMETQEVPPNETKVFKNVFVLSQNQTKSVSEPSSPEVKMEVVDDRDNDTCGHSGLMSLPEGIFSKIEDDKRHRQVGRQRKMVTHRLGGSLLASRGKLPLPILSSSMVKNTEADTQRDEHKSVLLRVIPSGNTAGFSVVASTAAALNSSSSQASECILLSKPTSNVLSSPSTSFHLSSVSPSVASSSNDTGTLTSMQARLFQMLLKKYNIDPSNEVSTSSSNGRPVSTSLSPVPLKGTLATASAILTTPCVRTSSQQHTPDTSHKDSVTSDEQMAHFTKSSSIYNLQNFHYRHTPTAMPASSHISMSENGIHLNSEQSKTSETPLNLCISSSRQENQDGSDGRSIPVSKVKLDDSAYAIQPLYTPQTSANGELVMLLKGNLPDLGSKGKGMSTGVQGDSENAREDTIDGDKGHIGMCLLHDGQLHTPITVVPRSTTITSIAGTAGIQSGGDVSQPQLVAIQPEQKSSLGMVGDSSRFTSTSQTATLNVRDYYSQQSQIQTQTSSALSQMVSSPMPLSIIQTSVPTVLELAADSNNSTQKKHVIALASNPPTLVNMAKTTSFAHSSLSNSLLLPTASSSPMFLHQRHVIDLSRGKEKKVPSLAASQSLPLSLSANSGQGKIIGFSGAVLSVESPKLDREDKRPPKEAVPKEFPKKRGRKSQRSLPGLTLAADIGLGKINSETDEKLKKFLDAKKSENNLSVLSNTVNLIFRQPETQASSIEVEMNETEILDTSFKAQPPEGHIDKMYKTVGIFSGNVQHVKVGKKSGMHSSVVTSLSALLPAQTSSSTSTHSVLLPVQSSTSLSMRCLQENKISDVVKTEVKSSEDACREQHGSVTLCTVLSPSDISGKPDIKQISLGMAVDSMLDCKKETSENDVSNYVSDSSNIITKLASARLPGDSVLKKSKQKSVKSPSVCGIKEKTGAFFGKKDQPTVQRTSSGFDSSNRYSFQSDKVKKCDVSRMVDKIIPMKGNCFEVLKKGKKSPAKSSLEAVKKCEGESSVQAPSPNCDSFPRHKKHPGRRKLQGQEKGQTPKTMLASDSQLHTVKSSSTDASKIDDSAFSDTGNLDRQNVFSSADAGNLDRQNVFSSTDTGDHVSPSSLSDGMTINAADVVLHTNVIAKYDDDDDDAEFGDQPVLVIEEAQQEMS